MKIPIDIAAIIAKVGEQELTISERRRLSDWYRRLNCGHNSQFSDDEAAAIEEKSLKGFRVSL
ncbi:hypothetical protein [Parapedobacter sp. DT-150]|uniref:hypothetical protein n=1 Tax=Parapedobacter sp. DT-150 TaxID=3396162 RepID=UPI003F1E0C70